jgi:hypothetical protein
MKIVTQKQKIKIAGFELKENKQRRKHSQLLPNSIRCVISGPSSCGKTAVLLSLITDPNGLKFENIYVYSKSLYQAKYQFLEQVLKRVKGVGFFKYSENEEVIKPCDARNNSIFIFDDIICDKQNNVSAFFSMGRHKDVDCFYLCQTYTRIPKQLVRDNANMLVIFKQDNNNLKHIFNNHVNPDMTFTEFENICRLCWNKKYGFLVIDKESDLNNGRYRNGFDKFIIKQ